MSAEKGVKAKCSEKTFQALLVNFPPEKIFTASKEA